MEWDGSKYAVKIVDLGEVPPGFMGRASTDVHAPIRPLVLLLKVVYQTNEAPTPSLSSLTQSPDWIL
jgi:hypothetical protein